MDNTRFDILEARIMMSADRILLKRRVQGLERELVDRQTDSNPEEGTSPVSGAQHTGLVQTDICTDSTGTATTLDYANTETGLPDSRFKIPFTNNIKIVNNTTWEWREGRN